MGLMFNGQPLPDKIGVEGWMLSTPKLTQRTVDVPDRRGLIYTGSKLGNRALVLTVAMLADSWAEAVVLHQRLCEWALTDAPAPLVLPERESQYIMAQCDAFPAPQMNEWWAPFEVGFTCPRPEFIDAFPHSRALESDVAGGDYWEMPLITGGTLGAPVQLHITLNEDVTGLSFYVDNHFITLDGSIAAGAVEIDTESGAVTLDDSDITYLATLSSDLVFDIAPGIHRIGWPTGVALSGSVEWRERWL